MNLMPFSRVKEAWSYREEPENMRAIGLFVWHVLLVLILLCACVAAWFGYQELQAAMQAENTSQDLTAPPAPLDPNKLEAQINEFNAQQVSYEALSQSSLPQIGDPSK
jgi:hypothetical protein